MSNSITLEPVASVRTEYPAEVEYRLTVEDQVAFWAYLACRAPQMLPERVRQRLKDSVALLQGMVGLLAMIGLSLLAWAVYPPAVGPCAVLTFMVGLVGMGFLDALVSDRPGMFLEGSASRLSCRTFLRGLRELAGRDERAGTLDTVSCYRFTLSAQGFTRKAERRETRTGPITVTTRLTTEENAPWQALAFIGRAEQHVFFVVSDGTVVIVPRRCFAGEGDFRRFVEAAQAHQVAARGRIPGTAITARVPALPDNRSSRTGYVPAD
jgi:hypothetical protein